MKTYKLQQALLFVGLLQFVSIKLEAGNHRTKPIIKLTSVFTKETDVKNKEILKIYDDLSYEFLFFEFYNKKPRVKREKGTYSLKKQKLTLKNSGKTQPKEHSERFIIKENEGLFACNRFGKIDRLSQSSYVDNKDKKFWQATYIDFVFGEITNDKKATKKIIEKKPEYNPVLDKTPIIDIVQKPQILVNDSIVDRILGKKHLSLDSLKQLKAIIIVGPVSKEYDIYSINNQKKNAAYLRSIGIEVIEFYPPNDKWESIVKSCEGAHILIYSGHGSNQGINYDAGGICLTEGIYHAQDILNEFKLHKNSLILFNSVCRAAGSSASDNGDIGKNEALKRVAEYAYPFYKLYAGGYYANNYGDCLIPFLSSFLKNEKIKGIYTKEASVWNKIEVFKKFQYDQNYEISVSSRPGTGEMYERISYTNDVKKVEKVRDSKSYDVAYVGKPNFTVVDLFK
jgi:hypothetical protein